MKIKKRQKGIPKLWVLEPQKYAEAVRSLRLLENTIVKYYRKKGKQTFLLTSSERRSGVSTIAFNLALVCSSDHHELRFVVVDANIYHPTLHDTFNVQRELGFLDFFHGTSMLKKVTQDSFIPNLKLITLGKKNEHDLSVFSLNVLSNFMKSIKKEYDIIFFDSGTYFTSPETQSISSQSDAVIIIEEANKARLQVVGELTKSLQQNDAHLIGSFLNHRLKVIPNFLYNFL